MDISLNFANRCVLLLLLQVLLTRGMHCQQTFRRLPQSGQHLGCVYVSKRANLMQKCRSVPKLWPKNETTVRHLGFSKTWFLSNGWPCATDLQSRCHIWWKMLIAAQIRAQKRNSKWRPQPSWIYFRLQFLTYSRLSTVDLNNHTIFDGNTSIGGWLMVTFQNSRWRPSAILDFRKCEFWPIGSLGMLIFQHGTKFGAKMLIAPKLWPKNEIQNGGRRHLEFTSGGYFWSVDLNHHTKFRDSSRRLTTVTFQNWRWRPSAILDFRKPDFWPMARLGLQISFHHGTKFGTLLIGAQIMAQKRNSKWRPQPSWIYFRWLFLAYSRLSFCLLWPMIMIA